MSRTFSDAVGIYFELGWDQANHSEVMSLSLGTKEQQEIAKKDLSKGDWWEFLEHNRTTGVFLAGREVDQEKFGAFAVRMGVNVRKAALLFPTQYGGWTVELGTDLLVSRGPKFVTSFAEQRRIPRFFGDEVIRAVSVTDAEIPDSTEYLERWVFRVADSLIPSGEQEPLPIEIIEARFADHLRAVLGSGMNVPGVTFKRPTLDVVIGEGVERGFFDREEARELVLFAMEGARRPKDRLAHARTLTQTLDTPSEWLKDHASILLSTISQGPDQVITLFAPTLLSTGDNETVLSTMLIGINAKNAKAKVELLEAAIAAPPPKAETSAMIAESLAPLLTDKNRKVAKGAQALLDAWETEAEPLSEESREIRGLWRATPKKVDAPRFDAGPITSENLTALAAEVMATGSVSCTLAGEKVLWVANALAHEDEEATRTALRGVKDAWGVGLSAVEPWVHGTEPHRRDEPGRVRPPITARDESIYCRLGAVPVLLSTPSFDDYTITPEDLAERLAIYANAGEPVVEADLQMALPRIDIDLLNDATREVLCSYDVSIVLQDGFLIKRQETGAKKLVARLRGGSAVTVGEVLTLWFEQEVTEKRDPADKPAYLGTGEPVPALAQLPIRLADRWVYPDMPLVPLWSDARIPSDYHAAAVLRKYPHGRESSTQLLETQGDDATDLGVTLKAWENGMLLPGVAQAELLAHRGAIPALASRVEPWSELAESGMLSVVWPLVADVVRYSSSSPRIAPGVAELIDMLAEYLPEVVAAVEAGLAGQEELELAGVRAIAERSGSSRAVSASQQLVAVLPDIEVTAEPEQGLTGEEFNEAWPTGPDPDVLDDGAFLSLEWSEGPEDKSLGVSITLADGETYRTGRLGWLFSITREYQIPVEDWTETDQWLYYDAALGRLAMKVGRDSEDEGSYVYSQTMVEWLLCTQLDPGDNPSYDYYGLLSPYQFRKDHIGPTRIAVAFDSLLRQETVDPYRLVRQLRKYPKALPSLYPVLTRSIAHAVTLEGKPPRWLVWILDVATEFAPILKEAGARGLLFEEDASWPGLAEISESSQSPAARKKAGNLLRLLA